MAQEKAQQPVSPAAERGSRPGPWPPGCIELIGTGNRPGCTLTSVALAVALARQGSAVALLLEPSGHGPRELYDRMAMKAWEPLPAEVPVMPGVVRVGQQHLFTGSEPRALLAQEMRRLADEGVPGVDIAAFERPLPGDHLLTPEQRRAKHERQNKRAEIRRLLLDGEVGEIVIIDSGEGPRVSGIRVDYTLVVHKSEPGGDWKDLDQVGFPDRPPQEVARRLADRFAAPDGPWSLILPRHRDRQPGFREALRDALRDLGMTALEEVVSVPHHEDFRSWTSVPSPRIPDIGFAQALRAAGPVTNHIDDLLGTSIKALINHGPTASH
ncbi:hypothetical protein AB0C88_38150 [Streptomyces chartreusis]|uniref:hypothetical protein n=1 Tax=Streptomyces chartreusis TaxID=1969 RepID=UPI0033F8AD72